MEINVLNIKGQETGRKVTLNESIFGIEPNDHVLYLDVKQYLANQRQGTAKSKERSEISGSTRSSDVRRVAAVPVMVTSTRRCCAVVVASSARSPVTTASS